MSATSNPPLSTRSSLSNLLSNAVGAHRPPAVACCAIFGLACAAGWALAPRVLAQEAAPVFRARTELVRLDVSITDTDGRPVDDVRRDEIEITEGGRRRDVVLFRHMLDARAAGTEAASAGFEEVSRNEVAPSGHLYVLVFDQLHIAPGDEQAPRLAAERFLDGQLRAGDAVAVYGLPGPGPVVSMTTDRRKARASLAAVRGRAERMSGGMTLFEAYRLARGGSQAGDIMPTRPAIDLVADPGPGATPFAGTSRAPLDEQRSEQALQAVARADTQSQIFLSQLADTMRHLRSIDARKTFVLFSQGFFIDDLVPQLEQVAAAAAQSDSVVYAVDLNRGQGARDGGAPMSALEISERRDPLAALAAETDGRLLANASDLDRALAGIAAETNDHYLVAFEPSAADAPHGYHRVKITVNRHGLVAHARTGYSTPAPHDPLADRQAIDAALTVPRTSTALPIEYTTYERSGASADKPTIIASLTAYLPNRPVEDRADIVFVVRDATTGQAVASGTDRLPAPQSTERSELTPVPYCVRFDVPPGEYWMRVLVREPGGVIGTADRRFHVWPLTGTGFTTSDLIVTRLDGARFDPPANAAVHREDDVLAYLEVYGGAAGQVPETRVDVVRAGSDEVIATADPLVKSGSRGEHIIRARLPVAGLAEGLYAVRVRVGASNQALRTVVRTFRVLAESRSHSGQ